MAAGRQYIDVTGEPFAPSRYGLLTVANELDIADSHWQLGVEFQPLACAPASVTRDSCSTAVLGKVPNITGAPAFGAEPFTPYAWVLCGPVGIPRAEYERRATLALERGEGRAVENVFWSGLVNGEPVYPHLASNVEVESDGAVIQTAATPVVTGAVDPVEALGLLEGELAECYGGEGVIHVPARAVAHLAAWSQLVTDGDTLRTFYGNKVAVYASNGRQGPDGTEPVDPNHAWFYATGAVSYLRSGIMMTPYEESLNRATNTLAQIAERTYLIKWDCCHLAAQVELVGIT